RLRDPATRLTAQRVLATVLDSLVRLLHPVMPFLAEQIWQALGEHARARGLEPSTAAPSVMVAPWPSLHNEWRGTDVERRMERLVQVIKAIRNIRSEFSIDARKPV